MLSGTNISKHMLNKLVFKRKNMTPKRQNNHFSESQMCSLLGLFFVIAFSNLPVSEKQNSQERIPHDTFQSSSGRSSPNLLWRWSHVFSFFHLRQKSDLLPTKEFPDGGNWCQILWSTGREPNGRDHKTQRGNILLRKHTTFPPAHIIPNWLNLKPRKIPTKLEKDFLVFYCKRNLLKTKDSFYGEISLMKQIRTERGKL